MNEMSICALLWQFYRPSFSSLQMFLWPFIPFLCRYPKHHPAGTALGSLPAFSWLLDNQLHLGLCVKLIKSCYMSYLIKIPPLCFSLGHCLIFQSFYFGSRLLPWGEDLSLTSLSSHSGPSIIVSLNPQAKFSLSLHHHWALRNLDQTLVFILSDSRSLVDL